MRRSSFLTFTHSTRVAGLALSLTLGLALTSGCDDKCGGKTCESATDALVDAGSNGPHDGAVDRVNDVSMDLKDAGGDVAGDISAHDGADAADDGGSDAVDALAVCDFATSYQYGPNGGNGIYDIRSFLDPQNRYTHQVSYRRGVSDGGMVSCAPALPVCGAQDVITAYDIEVHDLRNADVVAALAEAPTPLFGWDDRPVDGTVFEFRRSDGRGFFIGRPCDNHNDAKCRPIPAGLRQLEKRLLDLDSQQLADASCAAIPGR